MKMKTFFIVLVVLGGLALGIIPSKGQAGEVKTKDNPKKCGGYHGGSYHLKCEGEKKNFVDRDQGWKNPFKGFTGKSGKPKKQGEMPHSP